MRTDQTREVIVGQDYYPYGEILRSYTTGADVNSKYRFTEKERDTETNYDYFGARYYDSELGRWTSIDPLWEKYHGWSPYNYTLNNPLRFIDPDGREAVEAEPEDDERDKQKKQHEATFNYLKKVANTFEKAVKIISNKTVEATNNTGKTLQNGSNVIVQTILKDGPSFLNNVSDGVAIAGGAIGLGIRTTGHVEIGAPIIAESFKTSTILDAAAFGLALIDYSVNNGKIDNVNSQLQRMMSGAFLGSSFVKVTGAIKKFKPLFNPIIF